MTIEDSSPQVPQQRRLTRQTIKAGIKEMQGNSNRDRRIESATLDPCFSSVYAGTALAFAGQAGFASYSPALQPSPLETSVIYRVPRLDPYALGMKRPSPTELLGLTIFVVIVGAALLGLMYYIR